MSPLTTLRGAACPPGTALFPGHPALPPGQPSLLPGHPSVPPLGCYTTSRARTQGCRGERGVADLGRTARGSPAGSWAGRQGGGREKEGSPG